VKKMLYVLCLICAVFASGCGGGGGSSASLPATTTTIAGTMTVPSVTASGIVSNITYPNDSALMASFSASAVCTVNGQQVAYSFATATQYFYIFELTPAEQYDVKFTYENLTLRSIVPHTSTALIKNVDLNTTAEALLFEKYQFTAAQIKYFEIDPTLKDGLANKMLTWLQTPALTNITFNSALSGELASFSLNVTREALGSDLTPARDLTGVWKGTNVVYYEFNLNGDRAIKNTADMTLTLTQSGSAITGVLDTTIKKYEVLTPELYYPPVGMSSTISGKVSSTNLTFTGRSFSGAFTFTSDLMMGTLTNTDLKYFFGFESDTNALKLMRQ
jgi:hypothetical protein